jgi:hypothetical protein
MSSKHLVWFTLVVVQYNLVIKILSVHRGGNNHSPTRQMRVEFGISE